MAAATAANCAVQTAEASPNRAEITCRADDGQVTRVERID